MLTHSDRLLEGLDKAHLMKPNHLVVTPDSKVITSTQP